MPPDPGQQILPVNKVGQKRSWREGREQLARRDQEVKWTPEVENREGLGEGLCSRNDVTRNRAEAAQTYIKALGRLGIFYLRIGKRKDSKEVLVYPGP
jgi:hypothetical protein